MHRTFAVLRGACERVTLPFAFLMMMVCVTSRNLGLTVHISFFELYGGRCRDLLFKKSKVRVAAATSSSQRRTLLATLADSLA